MEQKRKAKAIPGGSGRDSRPSRATGGIERDSRPLSPAELRAAHQFWNAAGNYTIEPPRLFLTPDGIPLLYENTTSGLICKYFGYDSLPALGKTWQGDYRAPKLDMLAWLVLGEAAVVREAPKRPALAEMRTAFLERCDGTQHAILNALTPREKLASATKGQLAASIQSLAREHYGFDGRIITSPQTALHLGVGIAPRLAPRRHQNMNAILPQQARKSTSEQGGQPNSPFSRFLEERRQKRENATHDEIARCYGLSLISEERRWALEQLLCTGNHAGCRLWIAGGAVPQGTARTQAGKRMLDAAEEQTARSQQLFQNDRRLFEESAAKLASMLQDRLWASDTITRRKLPRGSFDATRAWRVDLLHDIHAFLRKEAFDRIDLAVCLLIDASGSRSDYAPDIATQSWVLEKGLRRAGARIQSWSFSSFADHSILRCLSPDFASIVTQGFSSDFPQGLSQAFSPALTRGASRSLSPALAANSAPGSAPDLAAALAARSASRNARLPYSALNYFSGGMNRDGLALRFAGHMLDMCTAKQKLVLVLTDAAPMDDVAFPPTAQQELARHDYIGKPALQDVAQEVRALRSRGIAVCALFHGEDGALSDGKRVYGTGNIVQIRALSRLAQSAADLIVASTQTDIPLTRPALDTP